MKKLYIILFIILFGPSLLYAQSDSGIDDTTEADTALIQKEKTVVETRTTDATTATKNTQSNAIVQCACVPKDSQVGPGGWLLVFLPAVIFLLVVGILLLQGLKDFNFTEALEENELTKVIIQNPLYNSSPDPEKLKDIPPTLEITANVNITNPAGSTSSGGNQYSIDKQSASYRASISRYIALISSLMIIIIATCTSSFFIYHYVRTGCPPDLSGLSTLLIALGVGIVPYAANKISTVLAANKSEA